ncbi:hypothetical protein JCM14469_13770 [Desulfatiferula olefinivorans]
MTHIIHDRRESGAAASVLAGFFLLVLSACSAWASGPVRLDSWQMSRHPSLNPETVLEQGDFIAADPSVLFRVPGEPVRGIRSVWLKSRVNLDDPRWVYGLSLGRVYVTDQVYVNGRLCGETDRVGSFHYPRHYHLPPGILTSGENVILIRLGIYGREYGGIPGPVLLLDRKGFNSRQMLDHLLFVHIPLGVIILYLGTLMILFMAWEPGVNGRAVAVLTGIVLVWVTHLLMIYSPIQPFGVGTRSNVLWMCTYINSLLFIRFIHLTYVRHIGPMNPLFVGFVGLAALALLIWNDSTAPAYPGRMLGPVVLLMTNLMALALLVRLTRLKGFAAMRLIWVFGYAPSLSITLDIVNYLYGDHGVPFYHVYVIPLMNLLVFLLYRRQFIRNRVTLESLRKKIHEASFHPDREDRKIALTAQVESRITALKEHIAHHFTQPLSRESLAGHMGLSPDYMSRMFKAHEGVRINDYINTLRVNEACRLLRESDLKIIDVAFAVGFESLATFNRVFYRHRRMAPSEYRLRNIP